MTNFKKICNFSNKWLKKFSNKEPKLKDLMDFSMAEECMELGFSLELGHKFLRKYGKETGKLDKLKEIIDEVNEIDLLGSAIFLNWRYFNHWAYDQSEILKEDNINWFIFTLNHLYHLAARNVYLFKGEIKSFILRSDAMVYGPPPEEGQVVRQDIYLDIEGRVSIKYYKYTKQMVRDKNFEKSDFKIRPEKAFKIFYELKKYFGEKYDPFELMIMDVGRWDAVIENTEGKKYSFNGPRFENQHEDLAYLSFFIRNLLERMDLFVFDGQAKTDRIKKLTLDYNRVTEIPIDRFLFDKNFDRAIWDYKESIIINREENTIEHNKIIGEECKVYQKFEVEGLIDSIFDNFKEEDLFKKIKGNPEDAIGIPDEIRKYKIIIDYEKKPQRIIEGDFDKRGLPGDFPDFAEILQESLNFYNFEEILNPKFYEKVRRLRDQYIYCSLDFGSGKKTYYYRTEDDEIEEGDLVLVPVGPDNHEAVAFVDKVEYFYKEDVPFPLEKTKFILEKYYEE